MGFVEGEEASGGAAGEGADSGGLDDGGGVVGEGGYPNESAKMEELIREIDENAGHHKALVFSQFTSMLRLIRQALEEKGIPYLYLDGSVPAEERRRAVQQFQEEDDTRIFLISL